MWSGFSGENNGQGLFDRMMPDGDLSMSLLERYRHHLAIEAAGGRGLFSRILGYFRKFWFACVFCAIIFLLFGVWVALTSDLSGGASMALIIFPFGALLICGLGALPYGLAQLFLSAKQSPENAPDDPS